MTILSDKTTMNRTTTTTRSTASGHAYYKITRTTTDAQGNKHTETTEVVDNDAIKVILITRVVNLIAFIFKAYARQRHA